MKTITIDIPTPKAFEKMLVRARELLRRWGGMPEREEQVAYIDLLLKAIRSEDGHA